MAQLLGYKSSNNGSYWAKLAALKSYGLLEGKSNIQVSSLGKQATYGTGEQKPDAIFQAVLNIPLWKAFYDRYRLELPSTDFWAQIQHITGCEAPVARSNEQFITDAYYADANLIKSVKTIDRGGDDTTVRPPQTGETIEITAGLFHQRLPLSIESIGVVEAMLSVLKNQLQSQREQAKEGE